MMIFSTAFTIWRIVVRFKLSPWMGPSDWLMILGMVCAVVEQWRYGSYRRVGSQRCGSPTRRGRQDDLSKPSHLAGQLLNLYSMWIVKLSICAYLLALNFSKRYRWVVWGTIVFVTVFNFLLPVTQHLGLCRPLASRWDTRITDKKCWSQMVRISIAYTQAISNIVTDLVYATTPIAYLRSVQLSKRTQWSVRFVFLMSLVYCTTISAIKLWDFQRIQGVKEVYYESATLSIWSMTEVSLGIVVANLPPLRKSFDGLLKHVISGSSPGNVFSASKYSNNNFQSFHLATFQGRQDRKSTRLRSTATGDNE
ncbi:hypothetical protein BDW02DRAFT_528991, partial [Decorospora gaudefroyi]